MNDRIRNILFNLSASLLLAGTILYLPKFFIAPYLFAVGAAGITVCNMTAPYKDLNFRQRRLHRFNVIASVLMIAASALMFKERNEWIICLSVATIFQTYAAFVLSKKENK